MGFDSTSDDQRNPKEIFFQFFILNRPSRLNKLRIFFSRCRQLFKTERYVSNDADNDLRRRLPDLSGRLNRIWMSKGSSFRVNENQSGRTKKILNFKAMINKVCVLGRSKIIQAELQRSFLQQSFCFRFYKLNKKNHSGPTNFLSRKLIWVDRSMPKQ